MRSEGITQDGKFTWFSFGKAIEQIISLCGIDRQEGKTSVQVRPTVSIVSLCHTHQLRISPATVARKLLNNGRHFGRVCLLERFDKSRSPQAAITLPACPGDQ